MSELGPEGPWMTVPAMDPVMVAACRAVLDAVAGGAPLPPSLKPPTLNTRQPLHPLSPELAAKQDARAAAGLSPEGVDYPRAQVWTRMVIPALAVGGIDLLGLVGAGLAAAHHVPWAGPVAGLALAAFIAIGVVSARAARSALRDPLRLSTPERRQLNQARSWQSSQSWLGLQSGGPEHLLLLQARDTVAEVAGSRAWGSRELEDHRTQLDLMAELDGIDAQAAQLADLRTQAGTRGPSAEQYSVRLSLAWDALLERVARLRLYADAVHALDQCGTELGTADRLDQALGRLAAGSALDQFAAEKLRTLSAELNSRS